MEKVKVRLKPDEALHALAKGKILENEDGADVLLSGSSIMLRYTMGRNNVLVEQNYGGEFDNLYLEKILEDDNATG